MTFHALAFSIVTRFGSIVGKNNVTLVSPAHIRLDPGPGKIGYEDLLPLALEILSKAPAARNYFRDRWRLLIVDEFQDCTDLQQRLLDELSAGNRLMLLGDPNQCIFTFLVADGVKLERINEARVKAGAEATVTLPDVSYRDPSGVIPSVARAVQERNFASPAIQHALKAGRMDVLTGINAGEVISKITELTVEARNVGDEVAIFAHHNDSLAALSDRLEEAGVEHEITGLSDALATALDAQVTMLKYANDQASWDEVLTAIAIFVTSSQRGNRTPPLALDIRSGSGARSLHERLSLWLISFRRRRSRIRSSSPQPHIMRSVCQRKPLPGQMQAR